MTKIPMKLTWEPFLLNPQLRKPQDLKEHLEKKYGKEAVSNFGDPNARLATMGRAVGIHFNPERQMLNTIPAHSIVEAVRATDNDLANKFMEELMKAYFEQALDLSDIPVLFRIVDRVGIDRQLAEKAIANDSDSILRKDQYHKSPASYDVHGVPFFIIEGDEGVQPVTFSGAYPVEVIAQYLRQISTDGK